MKVFGILALGLVGCSDGGDLCHYGERYVPGASTDETDCPTTSAPEPEKGGNSELCEFSFRTVCTLGAEACEEIEESTCSGEKLLLSGRRVPSTGIIHVNKRFGFSRNTTVNSVVGRFNQQLSGLTPPVKLEETECIAGGALGGCNRPSAVPLTNINSITLSESRDPVIPDTVGITRNCVSGAVTFGVPRGCNIILFMPTIRDFLRAFATPTTPVFDSAGITLVLLHELGHVAGLNHYTIVNPPTRSPMNNLALVDLRNGVAGLNLYSVYREAERQEIQSIILR